MLTEHDIREALRACFDTSARFGPKRNIVDLGLIESITLTADREAPGAGIAGVPPRQALTLILHASSLDEDANAILRAQIENLLAGIPNLSRITLHLKPMPFPILKTH